MRARRPLAVLAAGSLLVAMGAETAEAYGPPAAPVIVTVRGQGAIRVVVAEGAVFPCTSTDNRKLWDGKFEPGGTLNLSTLEGCVCVQHTLAPFAETDWAPSQLYCRPQICTHGWHGVPFCRPAPDPTIRVELGSTAP